MKNTLSVLVILALTLHSCITTKTYSTEEKKMRDPNAGTYVLTTKGEKISGKSISRPSSFKLKADYIKLDNKKYDNSDLVAYQDNNAFYKLFTRKGGDVWVKQLKRGKINLYSYETTPQPNVIAGTNASYHDHYVFEKESVGLTLAELSITDIAKILQDNKKAYETFTSQFGSEDKKFLPKQMDNHPKIFMKAIYIYNGIE